MQGILAKTWDGWSDTLLDWLGRGHATLEDETQQDSGSSSGPPKEMRRLIGLVALAIALLIGWWMWDRGPEVKVVAARVGDAAEVVYATGIIEPVRWAKVTAPFRRRIEEICKCEGEPVEKGQVLVRLDDEQEQAVLRELQWRLDRLKEDAERLDTLVKRNSASRVALDDKLTEVREYEARVAAQKDRVADLQLKSPLDGVVLRRDGEVGEMAGVSALGDADTLLWVGDPKPLQVVAEVNEDDILKVVPGQSVLLRHEGHSSSPLPATVDRITPKGDPESKTFRVYLALPDDTPLKIGMSVEANIVVAEAKGVIVLPSEAIVGGAVLKVTDGHVATVAIEEGIRGTGSVEIRSGIAEGDLVISPRASDLKDGNHVRPVRTDMP